MRVIVRVFGDLITSLGRGMTLDLDDGSNIRTMSRIITEQLGSRSGYIGDYRVGGQELLILVNGVNIVTLEGVETVIKDGDVITLLPPFAGG